MLRIDSASFSHPGSFDLIIAAQHVLWLLWDVGQFRTCGMQYSVRKFYTLTLKKTLFLNLLVGYTVFSLILSMCVLLQEVHCMYSIWEVLLRCPSCASTVIFNFSNMLFMKKCSELYWADKAVFVHIYNFRGFHPRICNVKFSIGPLF